MPTGEICPALTEGAGVPALDFLIFRAVRTVSGSAVSVMPPTVPAVLPEDPMRSVIESGIGTFPEELPVPPDQPSPAADAEDTILPVPDTLPEDPPVLSTSVTVLVVRGETAFLPAGSAMPLFPAPEDSPDSPNPGVNGFSPLLLVPVGAASGLCFPFGSVPASLFLRPAPPDEAVPS